MYEGDGGVAFCVVCGRFDRSLMPRKSGLKCVECVGKRSKKEYTQLQHQHATFMLAQSHRASMAMNSPHGSPMAIPKRPISTEAKNPVDALVLPSPAGQRRSACDIETPGSPSAHQQGASPKKADEGLYSPMSDPASPITPNTAKAIPSVIPEEERIPVDLDTIDVTVDSATTLTVDEERQLPLVNAKIKTQQQVTVYHFTVRRRYCPHETALNPAAGNVSYMCATCRKPIVIRPHRFSSALLLFNTLKHVGGDALPNLPEKKVFSRFNTDFIEQRRRAIEAFIQAITKNTFFIRHPQVLAFLGLYEDKTLTIPTTGSNVTNVTVGDSDETPSINQHALTAGTFASSTGLELPQEALWNWKRGSLLGKGSFGSVFLGLLPNTSQLLAVKVIRISSIAAPQLETLQTELSMLRTLNHPNIVRLLGAMWDRESKELCMFQEYVECGSLARMIKKFGALPFSVIQRFLLQIVQGVAYLHQKQIAHRDLKGDNILVGKDGTCKVADFGCASQLHALSNQDGELPVDIDAAGLGDVTGTPLWMSPEAMRGEANIGLSTDIWSLGCVGIEMLKRKIWNIGEKENVYTAMYRIQKGTGLPDGFPDESVPCPPSFRKFLTDCLNRDPTKRPRAEELLKHEFFFEDFIEVDPEHSSHASDDVASLVSGGGHSPRPSNAALHPPNALGRRRCPSPGAAIQPYTTNENPALKDTGI